MATSNATIAYLLDQLSSLPTVNARKMFGEYALYCDSKVVGLVCDDTLFMKRTDMGRDFIKSSKDTEYKEGLPYPGAKPWIEIGEDRTEDREWLSDLVSLTANALPHPKIKKKNSVPKT